VKRCPWRTRGHTRLISRMGLLHKHGAAPLYIAAPDCSHGVRNCIAKSLASIAFSSGILPSLHPTLPLQVCFNLFALRTSATSLSLRMQWTIRRAPMTLQTMRGSETLHPEAVLDPSSWVQDIQQAMVLRSTLYALRAQFVTSHPQNIFRPGHTQVQTDLIRISHQTPMLLALKWGIIRMLRRFWRSLMATYVSNPKQ
jgi:hypothetical protein